MLNLCCNIHPKAGNYVYVIVGWSRKHLSIHGIDHYVYVSVGWSRKHLSIHGIDHYSKTRYTY